MRIAFGLALVSAACALACGSSSSSSKGSAGSSGADNTAGGASSKGGASSDGGSSNGAAGSPEAGDSGTTPIVSTAAPHAAGGLVAGGVQAHSAHFSGVFSLGASPGGNGVLTSGTKQLRGGVLGASQK